MRKYQPVIGLEIHIELKTRSKMFCSCSAEYFGRSPNTHTCPTCLGLPGSLPVANKKAIEWTILAGLAFDCRIPLVSKFDRKNYFYPDLPKGYQISQYDLPLAVKGELKFKGLKAQGFRVRIRRVHLEEDTAKMIHPGKNIQNSKTQKLKKEGTTLIDFNRSGLSLMEIVTEPDIRSPREAKEFLRKLQQIIRYLEISDCDMEKGTMRCEANISLASKVKSYRKKGKLPDYKVEIKNLNSFRFVEKALIYEIERQKGVLLSGKTPVQETRGWDEVKQVTYPQRLKEEAHDYRYFPEPDLPPIRWKKLEIKKLRSLLPELPDEKIARFEKEYELSQDQVRILTDTREKADYFEEAVRVGRRHGFFAQELAKVIVNKRVDIEELLPAELIQILTKKKAKFKISKKELEKIINEVIKENSKAVEDYKKGKENAMMFLLGQVQRKTRGTSEPRKAREMIIKKLKTV